MQKKTIIGFMLLATLTGCAMPYNQQAGATTGGLVGGVAGLAIDHRNPWRGGVIGAAIGAITGATIAEISQQATNQAADAGRPVEYRMQAGSGYYYAEPIGYEGSCRKVRERVYDRNVLVSSKVVLVCRDERPVYVERRHKKDKHRKHDHHDDHDDDHDD